MLEAKRRVARTLSKRDAEVTLPAIDPEPTIVVECASCRTSCWLPRRARPSSVEGGRGAGRGLNPPSSGAGGSGGGGTTVKGGGTGEWAEAVTATIQCRSPRAIDRRPQAPSAGGEFIHSISFTTHHTQTFTTHQHAYIHNQNRGPTPLRSSWSFGCKCPRALLNSFN